MKLCHIVPSLAERHGGPSKSVRALANHAVEAGAEVELLATEVPGDVFTPAEDDCSKSNNRALAVKDVDVYQRLGRVFLTAPQPADGR